MKLIPALLITAFVASSAFAQVRHSEVGRNARNNMNSSDPVESLKKKAALVSSKIRRNLNTLSYEQIESLDNLLTQAIMVINGRVINPTPNPGPLPPMPMPLSVVSGSVEDRLMFRFEAVDVAGLLATCSEYMRVNGVSSYTNDITLDDRANGKQIDIRTEYMSKPSQVCGAIAAHALEKGIFQSSSRAMYRVAASIEGLFVALEGNHYQDLLDQCINAANANGVNSYSNDFKISINGSKFRSIRTDYMSTARSACQVILRDI